MIKIAITTAAFDAISATLPLGSVAVEPEANERGERLVWLEDAMADRLGAMRGAGNEERSLNAVRPHQNSFPCVSV